MKLLCKNPNCKHQYQDEKLGNHMREHNAIRMKDKSDQVYRCTVCGETRTASN